MSGFTAEELNNETLVLSVGDNAKRFELYKRYTKNTLKENIVHPQVWIERHTKLGRSNQIMAFTYINAGAMIADNNILNTRSTIEHEAEIGSHNHISVGSIIAGRAKIGNQCFIGASAVVIDKVKICDHVTIGANSVVLEDIKEPGVYVGNPVRKIK